MLIDNGGTHGLLKIQESIVLEDQCYDFKIYYGESIGQQSIRFTWWRDGENENLDLTTNYYIYQCKSIF